MSRSPSPSPRPVRSSKVIAELPTNSHDCREVGTQAVWSLSSCKPGFGVDQLRDNCLESYWQSDGPLPHLVNIQFRRKTCIKEVCIYADYKLDESYTPNRISVRAGSNFQDLHEIEMVDLNEPSGWIVIPLKDVNDQPIRAFLIQIAIKSNHQNGKDTHIRQIKIHSPTNSREVHVDTSLASLTSQLNLPHLNFSDVLFSQYSTIR